MIFTKVGVFVVGGGGNGDSGCCGGARCDYIDTNIFVVYTKILLRWGKVQNYFKKIILQA